VLRFVTLTHLNLRKEIFYKSHATDEDTATTIQLRFRFLKWFGTRFSQILQVIVLYVVLCVTNIVFLAPYTCRNSSASTALQFILYGSVIVMIMLVEVYDLILLVISVRSNCSFANVWKKLYHDDTFHFRAEFLFGFCLVGIPVTCAVLISVVIQAIPEASVTNKTYVAFVVNSIACLSCWWVGCGYILIITIMKTLTHICKRKSAQTPKNFMIEIMNDPILVDLFEGFVKSEFSGENFYCWKEIVEFKKNPSMRGGTAIYIKYLCQTKSELEITVPVALCTDVKRKLDNSTDGIVNTLSDGTFDKIFKVVSENLSDTYSRFIFSSQFVKYSRMSEMVELGLAN
jgi:hypothetical protein